MTHEEFIRSILSDLDSQGRIRARERNDLEYKETFNLGSKAKYARTMASFANNKGGYILFGVKDSPRVPKGVNQAFADFKQEVFTEYLNSMFSPEIIWESDMVDINGTVIGFLYTYEASVKPIIALKAENSEKINSGDVFFRYRARNDKIKFPEMNNIIEGRIRQEREHILRLMEVIRKSDTANLGIVNYSNGKFSTPFGADVVVDRRIITQVLRKAKYIKEGSFTENGGTPVIRVKGNIDLAEEIPVPNIEPDVNYPYLQKHLAEKLGIDKQLVYALIWKYHMKGQKKYHIGVSSSGITIHKFSDVALQRMAEILNEHKDDPQWAGRIKQEYAHRNNNQT